MIESTNAPHKTDADEATLVAWINFIFFTKNQLK